MNRRLAFLLCALLLLPVLCAAQDTQPKTVSRKNKVSKRPATPAAKATAPAAKAIYAELTISELIAEDANRWSDRMAGRAAVGGFITQVTKGEEGDTEIRICENPKIDGMDRARCVIAKCIPKLPCDVPQVGRPITVKGITRYDAKVGAHWWEIQPVEEIEK